MVPALLLLMLTVPVASGDFGPVEVSFPAGSPRNLRVRWTTSAAVEHAIAQLVPEEELQRPQAVILMALAQSEAIESGFRHTAILNAVDPSRTYRVRVGDGTRWTEWLPVEEPTKADPGGAAKRTPEAESDRYRFRLVVVGVLLLLSALFVLSEWRHRRRVPGRAD
jgi:Purple acid Phosphatase, N-terminal domain